MNKYIKDIMKIAKAKLPGWAYATLLNSISKDTELRSKVEKEGLRKIAEESYEQYTKGEIATLAASLDSDDDLRDVLVSRLKSETKKGFADGVPHNGLHAHGFRDKKSTHNDGAHLHLFVGEDIGAVITEIDGEHEHLDLNNQSGEHRHKVILPDGSTTFTELAGTHTHQAMIETTGFDGAHVHILKLPDGSEIESTMITEHQPSDPMPDSVTIASSIARATVDKKKSVKKHGNRRYNAEVKTETETTKQRGTILWELSELGESGDASTACHFSAVVKSGAAHVIDEETLTLKSVCTVGEQYNGDTVLVEVDKHGYRVVDSADSVDTLEDANWAIETEKSEVPLMLGFTGDINSSVLFVSPHPLPLEAARGVAFAGANKDIFVEKYLKPLGLDLTTARVGFCCPTTDVNDLDSFESDWSDWFESNKSVGRHVAVVALGSKARDALGDISDLNLPHPGAIRKHGDTGEIDRKIPQLLKLIEKRRGIATATPPADNVDASDVIDARSADVNSGEGAMLPVSIAKQHDGEKRVLLGVVLDPYRVDSHGDLVPPDVVESTAYGFMRSKQMIKLQHKDAISAEVVESFIEPYPSPEDRKAAIEGRPHTATRRKFGSDVITSGTWVLGVKFNDQVYNAYKKGELTGFSIGALTKRTQITETSLPKVTFIDLVPSRTDEKDKN